jgi:ERCC4-type nuclease
MLFSWLRSLDRVGITTHSTINEEDTARLLVAFHNNDQKQPEEHTVLNRYIRPRVVIQERNPLVKALIGMSWAYQLGIGEEKAKSLATRYKTLYDLNMAEVHELCQCAGIGKVIAEKLLRALGREDI